MPRTEQQGRCSSVVASGPHPRRPLLVRPAPRGRLLRPPFGLAEDGVHGAWPRRARYLAAIHAVGAAVAADCGRRPLGRCRRSSSVACSWTWPLCPTLAALAPTRWPGPMTPRSRRRRDPDATQAGLVARARAGHLHAFGQLARACADRLVAALLRLLGDRNEAGDVAQEVLLRAWRGWNQPFSGPLQVLCLALPDRDQPSQPLIAGERLQCRERAHRRGHASGECFRE
jgi:hypothetical protein